MTTIKVSDLFVPELLADAVKAGFSDAQALNGSAAAIVNTSMPAGKTQVGTTIKIPYFISLGEFEDLTNDGDALTPAALTSSAQTATVAHSGKAFEITEWAKMAAYGDPYEVAAKAIIDGAMRRVDLALLTLAKTQISSNYDKDITADATSTINYDAIVDARMKLGDEQDDWALMTVPPKVFGDMLKMKDASGRPLLTDIVEGGLSKFAGIPVKVSGRNTVSGSTYTNVLCKKGSLVAWINGMPDVKTVVDPLTNSEIVGVHIYYAVHAYNPMPGLTKPGLVRLLTK